MKVNKAIYWLLLIAWIMLLNSCASKLRLSPGKKLFWENSLKIVDTLKRPETKNMAADINQFMVPKPVKRTPGMSIKAKNYNPANDSHSKVRYGLFRQKPVEYDTNNLTRGTLVIKNFLNNQGYFNSYVDSFIEIKDNIKVIQHFVIYPSERYTINRIDYNCPSDTILQIIKDSFPSDYIKVGMPVTLNNNVLEKSRITNLLGARGYYKIDQANILFQMDTLSRVDKDTFAHYFPQSGIDTMTLQGNKIALMKVAINNKANSDTLSKFYLKSVKVLVYDPFNIDKPIVTSVIDGMTVIKPTKALPDYIFKDNIYSRPGDLYNETVKNFTNRKLQKLQLFLSTDITRDTIDAQYPNLINRTIVLNMAKRKSIGGDVSLYRSSLGAGLQLNFNYSSRNLYNSATKFYFNPSYSLDLTAPAGRAKLQLGNWDSLIRDNRVGASFGFSQPRLLLPGVKFSNKKTLLSETKINFTIFNNTRTKAFAFMNYDVSFGYTYQPNLKYTYEFKPLFTNITDYSFQDPSFTQQLETQYYLRQTYSPAFILGENFTFTITNQNTTKKKFKYMSTFSIEEAGGILQGIQALEGANGFLSKKSYSKYFKPDVTLSGIWNISKLSWANRILMGAGLLRADSKTLPFVKQYIIGGPNELRGFPTRSIGPGSYKDTSSSKLINIYQSGDIKFLFNSELRIPLKSISLVDLEGALFVDAGNIWTYTTDPTRPGATFRFKNLYKDLAISSGFGLRANISQIILIRFDLGTKLKYPDYFGVNGWITNVNNLNWFQFYKSQTRIEFAVGYPF